MTTRPRRVIGTRRPVQHIAPLADTRGSPVADWRDRAVAVSESRSKGKYVAAEGVAQLGRCHHGQRDAKSGERTRRPVVARAGTA